MRILLALDGSASSVAARDLIAGLAPPEGSRVDVITACEPALDADAPDLTALAEPLRRRGWGVSCMRLSGRPASVIIEAATETMPDLIVVGSRGRGPLQSMLLGSVSAEVVDHAPCPVLVVRTPAISRLLVASDGSTSAESLPAVVGSWGLFRGKTAEALCVTPDPDRLYGTLARLYSGATEVSDHAGGEERIVRRPIDIAEGVALRLHAAGIPATPVCVWGDPAHGIIVRARQSRADLIVVGTRGLSGLQRVVLGSVARNVLLHAPCSVLIVRGPAPARVGEPLDARVLAPGVRPPAQAGARAR